MPHRTLSVLAENTPRALAQVVSLIAGRGFPVSSLAACATEQPEISKITLVVDAADDQALEQITKQLNKLVVVLKVVDLSQETSVQRELVLAKVRADAATRAGVVEIAGLFRGKVVDLSAESVTVEATGSADKLDAMLRMFEPYGLIDVAQSGPVALTRGQRTATLERLAVRPFARAA